RGDDAVGHVDAALAPRADHARRRAGRAAGGSGPGRAHTHFGPRRLPLRQHAFPRCGGGRHPRLGDRGDRPASARPRLPLHRRHPPPVPGRAQSGRRHRRLHGAALRPVRRGRRGDAMVRGHVAVQVRLDLRLQPQPAPQGAAAGPHVRRAHGYDHWDDRRGDLAARMTWDFSTEPDFEKKLEWMRRFMRDEVYPLEVSDLDEKAFMRAVRPLQEEVKRQKLWAAHLPPELGGQGFGQVKLGLMHEILGTSPFGPNAFGCQAPDSGNSEILAIAGSPAQKERWLEPLLAGDLKSAFSMTEPHTSGADPTQLQTRAVRDGDEWVINGHKWFSSNASIADFLIVMAVTDPDARPHQRASMFVVPADTPGVNI